jgi:transposase InsO family protein
LVTGFDVAQNSQKPDCRACTEAKQAEKPFPRHSAHSTVNPGELTHLDLWGKYPVQSIEKHYYFLGLIDDATRYVTVEGLAEKSDAAQKIKDYITSLKANRRVPKAIRCDEGREFLSDNLVDWLKQEGMSIQTTAAYSPSQNGVAERMNCTLVELARAMISERKLPKFLWELAIKHAAYLHNRAYTRVCDRTPYEGWN